MSKDKVPITLALVDDEHFVIENLRDYFSSVDTIDVVLEAHNGEQALEKLKTTQVDVILSDINMPFMGGIGLLQEIKKSENPPAFIAMTGVDTDGSMLEILANGGAGYIIKSDSPDAFVRAIHDALNGGTTLTPECLSRLVNYIPIAATDQAAAQRKEIGLTPAESRVLSLVCQGHSNSEIAETLNYAESTVKKYVSHLMQHFEVNSRLKLALKALRTGWS